MDISQFTKTDLLSTKLSTEFYTAETTGSMLTALSEEIYDSIDDLTATYDAAGAAATAEQNAKGYTDDKIDDLTAVYDVAGAAAQAEAAAKSYAETLTAFYDVAGAAADALTAAKAYTDTAITNLIADAPQTFDTLKEIADWIEEDKSGLTALTSRITALETGKADKSQLTDYALSNDVSTIANLKADKSELTAYALSADLSATLEAVEDLVDRHSVLTADIETLATNGSISTATIIAKVNEIIGLLNTHLKENSETPVTPPYIPSSQPYTIGTNGTVLVQDLPTAFGVAGEPGWTTTIQSMPAREVVVNGRTWTFDPTGNNGQYNGIAVKTMTYMPETVAWIDYSTLAITQLNAEYPIEWIAPLQPGA